MSDLKRLYDLQGWYHGSFYDEHANYPTKFQTEIERDFQNSNLYILPDVCGSGDYVGSPVYLSNYEYIKKYFKPEEDEGWQDFRSGYGYKGILINVAKASDELLKKIEYLQTVYACADEFLASEVEEELKAEAWESFGHDDFQRQIEKLIKKEINPEDAEEYLLNLGYSKEISREIFEQLCERENLYWEFSGTQAFPLIEKLVERIDYDDVVEYLQPFKKETL